MAKFPQSVSFRNIGETRLPDIRTPSAASFGGEVAEGVASFGGVMAEIGRRMAGDVQEAADSSAILEARAALAEEIQGRIDGLRTAEELPDPMEVKREFEALIPGKTDEIMSKHSASSGARAGVQSSLTNSVLNGYSQFGAFYRDEQRSRALGKLTDVVNDAVVEGAAKRDLSGTLAGIEDLISSTPFLSVSERDDLRREVMPKAVKEMVAGNLQSNPGWVLKELRSGKWDKVIDDPGWKANVEYQVEQQAIAKARAASAARTEAMLGAFINGTAAAVPQAAQIELMNALASGDVGKISDATTRALKAGNLERAGYNTTLLSKKQSEAFIEHLDSLPTDQRGAVLRSINESANGNLLLRNLIRHGLPGGDAFRADVGVEGQNILRKTDAFLKNNKINKSDIDAVRDEVNTEFAPIYNAMVREDPVNGPEKAEYLRAIVLQNAAALNMMGDGNPVGRALKIRTERYATETIGGAEVEVPRTQRTVNTDGTELVVPTMLPRIEEEQRRLTQPYLARAKRVMPLAGSDPDEVREIVTETLLESGTWRKFGNKMVWGEQLADGGFQPYFDAETKAPAAVVDMALASANEDLDERRTFFFESELPGGRKLTTSPIDRDLAIVRNKQRLDYILEKAPVETREMLERIGTEALYMPPKEFDAFMEEHLGE